MAAQQVQLQRLERVGRDLHFGEGSEPGIDSVRRFVAARPPFDDSARGVDAVARRRRQRHRFVAIRNRDELFERQGRAVEVNHVVVSCQ